MKPGIKFGITGIQFAVTVTLQGGPSVNGESIQCWAQDQAGGAPFQLSISTPTLSILTPPNVYQATFGIQKHPTFTSGHIYNVWAAYPGDGGNNASTSNVIAMTVT